MTVTELVLNFRSALLAVLPMVEALRIPWKRGDAYDEWDDLASCMYEQLVGSLISALSASTSEEPVRLAAYDMMLRGYGGYATIDVQSDALGPGRWVFHAFCTEAEPFDAIEVREVSSDGAPCSEGLRTCALSGCRFSLTLPNGSSVARLSLNSQT